VIDVTGVAVEINRHNIKRWIAQIERLHANAVTEIPDFWNEPLLGLILLGRLGVTGFGFGLTWFIYRYRSTALIDWGTLCFTIAVSVSVVFLLEVHAITYQREPHMLTALMAFVMVSMCVWILAPARFDIQIAGSIAIAVIFAIFVWHTSPEDNVSIVFSAILFGIANGIGATISHRLHELRRMEWAALETERETRKRLEAEIEQRQKLEEALEDRTAELIDLNAELLASKEEADTANKAKSEFLSSMSHELRTPLNSILGFGQLLESNLEDSLAAEQKECVGHIIDGGEHLLTLIDDILDLAKIESGKLNISLEEVRLDEVCLDCLALIDKISTDRGLSIDRDLGGASSIRADYTRFKQVLLNLLSNAVKYNRQGGNITLICEQIPDDMIRICVTDTGSGIDADKQAGLFEPFNRLGREVSQIEGTGIGLTITKQLVEKMDGRIGFKSDVGKGSSFWVDFPRMERTLAERTAR